MILKEYNLVGGDENGLKFIAAIVRTMPCTKDETCPWGIHVHVVYFDPPYNYFYYYQFVEFSYVIFDIANFYLFVYL